jgi:hypothetical protein
MNEVKVPFGIRKFEQDGSLKTNDEELFANTVMQLLERGITFKLGETVDHKYSIIKA